MQFRPLSTEWQVDLDSIPWYREFVAVWEAHGGEQIAAQKSQSCQQLHQFLYAFFALILVMIRPAKKLSVHMDR